MTAARAQGDRDAKPTSTLELRRYLEISSFNPIKIMTAISSTSFAAGYNCGEVIIYRIRLEDAPPVRV
jgi:hypothetical protein